MPEIHSYNETARRRIADSVRWTERNRTKTHRHVRGGRMPSLAPQWAIADVDIEHDAFGTADLAEGSSYDSAFTAGRQLSEIYNPGSKIWSGARLLLLRAALASAGNEAAKYVVIQAWSATRIRGTAQGTISAGSTGTIDSVTTQNGHFGQTTAQVYLPTNHVEIADNMVTWAELEYQEGSGTSRWLVYSADCEEAGS